MICRHCQQDRYHRARSLCYRCYMVPEVRLISPPLRPCGRREEIYADGRLPSSPTDAAPGSEAKILVMIKRRQRGEALFHPDDYLENTLTMVATLRNVRVFPATETNDQIQPDPDRLAAAC